MIIKSKGLMLLAFTMGVLSSGFAQDKITGVGLTVSGRFDVTEAASTAPVKVGSAVPPTCAVGDMFFDSDEVPGAGLLTCTATNVWTAIGVCGGCVLTTGGYANPTWITSLSGAKIVGPVLTASSLSANPANCASGLLPRGIDATGAAEGCLPVDLSVDVGGVLPNSRTTAVSSNTVSSIVARDSSGNFSAGTITANVNGNSTTSTSLASNGANCAAGNFPIGVDAFGASESCTPLPTSISGTTGQIAASGATGNIVLSLPSAGLVLPGTTQVPAAVFPMNVQASVPLSFQPTLPYSKSYPGPARSIEFLGGTAVPCSPPYCLASYFTEAGAYLTGSVVTVSNKRIDINGEIQGVSATNAGTVPTEPTGISYSPDINGPGLAVEMYSDGSTVSDHNNQSLLAGYDLNDILSGSATPYSAGLGRKKFALGLSWLRWGGDLGVSPLTSSTTDLSWLGPGIDGLRLRTTSTFQPAFIVSSPTGSSETLLITSAGTEASLRLANSTAAGRNWRMVSSGSGSSYGASKLVILDQNNNPMVTFLDGNQRMAVGSTSDFGYKLSVVGTQNANDVVSYNPTISSGVRMGQVDAWGHVFTTGAKDLRFGTNGSDDHLVLVNGTGKLVAFQGSTSSYPALKRSGSTLQVRLADDSAFADVQAFSVVTRQATPSSSTDSCIAGGMWNDVNYVYVCTSSGVIKRVSLSTF